MLNPDELKFSTSKVYGSPEQQRELVKKELDNLSYDWRNELISDAAHYFEGHKGMPAEDMLAAIRSEFESWGSVSCCGFVKRKDEEDSD